MSPNRLFPKCCEICDTTQSSGSDVNIIVEYYVPYSSPTRLHNNNSWSIQRQRCLCGSCGIQHHMSRDPGTASPTHASGDGQADLGPRCAPRWGP